MSFHCPWSHPASRGCYVHLRCLVAVPHRPKRRARQQSSNVKKTDEKKMKMDETLARKSEDNIVSGMHRAAMCHFQLETCLNSLANQAGDFL